MAAGALAEIGDEIVSSGRIQLVKGPEDDEDDQDKSPKIITIHENKLGLAGLSTAFRDLGDSRLGDFELRIGRADVESLVFDGDDDGNDAAAGNDLIAGLDGLEHLGVFFGLLLLGTKEDEVKGDEKQDKRHKTGPGRGPSLLTGGRRRPHPQHRSDS